MGGLWSIGNDRGCARKGEKVAEKRYNSCLSRHILPTLGKVQTGEKPSSTDDQSHAIACSRHVSWKVLLKASAVVGIMLRSFLSCPLQVCAFKQQHGLFIRQWQSAWPIFLFTPSSVSHPLRKGGVAAGRPSQHGKNKYTCPASKRQLLLLHRACPS